MAEVTDRALIPARDASPTRGTALSECTEKTVSTEEISALIYAAITVIIFSIADLFGIFSTEATEITCPLIDHPITVIVFTITDLIYEASFGETDDLTELTAARSAPSACAD